VLVLAQLLQLCGATRRVSSASCFSSGSCATRVSRRCNAQL
ncbi:hypothetical protein A2U01_0065673, partial [Trifolium medium]|nr:hypothetical protein [Trifolium medium]